MGRAKRIRFKVGKFDEEDGCWWCITRPVTGFRSPGQARRKVEKMFGRSWSSFWRMGYRVLAVQEKE